MCDGSLHCVQCDVVAHLLVSMMDTRVCGPHFDGPGPVMGVHVMDMNWYLAMAQGMAQGMDKRCVRALWPCLTMPC